MRLSMIITTHERPDALAVVLASVRRQSRLPDELLVADDGSGPSTAAVIAAHAAQADYPTRHLRQVHQGFRVARLRNLALAAARGDYVVLLDGDMLLHPEWLADHVRAARRGCWVQGVRVPLDAALTQRVLNDGLAPSPFAQGLGFLRRTYLWHAPSLQTVLAPLGNLLVAVKACNQGFWLDDLRDANGFDEHIEGWGPEDKELCARLANAGIRRRTLLGGGIAWHLAHPPAPRDRRGIGAAVLRETLRSGRTRCARGLDGHA
jgi:glycosyltransferase involved in cell wall biosynthesis